MKERIVTHSFPLPRVLPIKLRRFLFCPVTSLSARASPVHVHLYPYIYSLLQIHTPTVEIYEPPKGETSPVASLSLPMGAAVLK